MPGTFVGGVDYPEAAPDPRWAPVGRFDGSSASLTVGVIDTGVVSQGARIHPWFERQVEYGPWGDVDPLDTDHDGLVDRADAHGTFVTGLILRQAPTVRVKMLRVLDDDLGDDAAVAAALQMLAAEVKLINLSFGGTADEDSPPRVLEYALQNLPDDVVVVCSAGNFGDTRPHWPGAFERVVAVGAVDERPTGMGDRVVPPVAAFSTRGSWVDAYAGGVGVLGPYCWFSESVASAEALGRPAQHFEGWARWSGTSFAAATVTGQIARLAAEGMSVREACVHTLDPSTHELIDDGLGHGGAPWVRGVDTPHVVADPEIRSLARHDAPGE